MQHHVTRTVVTGVIALALVAVPSVAAHAAPPAGAVVNPGFENGLDGWRTSGDRGAARLESGGADSPTRLTHWLEEQGAVSTTQRIRPAESGWYTVSARVKSGGGPASSRLEATGCGTPAATVLPSTETDDSWLRLSVSFHTSRGGCTIGLTTEGPAGSWASLDQVELTAGRTERLIRGADLSGVRKNEDYGAVYAAPNGRRVDPVDAFAAAGADLGRLRVWVDPADGYNALDDVVATGRRITDAGMGVLVDFHYSDRWTDPGAQGVPAAWADSDVPTMTAQLREHTLEVLTALRDAGVDVRFVQVGNEINPGMLWPHGQTWDVVPGDGVDTPQWDALAGFLTAGSTATTEVFPDARVILHLTNINNGIGSLTWWFDEIVAREVPFDVVGLSYYSYWHGSFADLQEAVTVLSSRYDRDVLVVETAYPWTLADDPVDPWENVIDLESELTPGYPATPEGQAANFRAVQEVVRAAPGGRGLGAVYWEPAWTAVPGAGWDPADPASGNAWENQAMFDFDGRLLVPGFRQFLPDSGTVPPGWRALLR